MLHQYDRKKIKCHELFIEDAVIASFEMQISNEWGSDFLNRGQNQLQICSSTVLKSRDGQKTVELQFQTCNKPSTYGNDLLSQCLCMFLIFSLCQDKILVKKISDICFYQNHNKTDLRTYFKSQDRNTYLYLKFIDCNLFLSWVPSHFGQHVLPTLSQEKQLNFHEKYCQFSIGQYTSQRLLSYIFIYGITTYQ